MTDVRASVLCLYVFSGPHLGARIDLPAGTWVVGADDACDIILAGLAARHAVLDVSVAEDGAPALDVSALDGTVRLADAQEAIQEGSVRPSAGTAWYLGQVCLAWNRPGIPQPVLVPEMAVAPQAPAAQAPSAPEAEAPAPASSAVPSGDSSVATASPPVPAENGNDVLIPLPEEPLSPPHPPRPLRRAVLLGLVAAGLIALSLVLTPAGADPQQYPALVQEYLESAGIRGLQVMSRSPGVEVRGTVADEATMVKLRNMARGLQIPVYLEVAVQADMLRAVRSSLGIRGFYPDVTLWNTKGTPRLRIAAYMKDGLLETAAFAALKDEVRGLPEMDRHIVHEEDLAPVLETALKQAGLSAVRAVYLPGRVDFTGDIRPEDSRKLDDIRKDAGELFGIQLHGTSSASGALAAAEQALTPSREAPAAPGEAPRPTASGTADPLGGLRVTGVTMSPMRFVTTADGRRLFEGAVLPGGWTLESIDTKVLMLRNGNQVVSHKLRGK